MLAGVHYDPGTAAPESATLLAMTAIDTTNLRLSVTVPASGRVFVRLRGTLHGGDHAGDLPRCPRRIHDQDACGPVPQLVERRDRAATDLHACEASAVISGLTPGAVNWDAAYSVDAVVASSGLKYGGPNDATGNNAFGGFTFEAWAA